MIRNSKNTEDRLADFTTDLRVLVISFMALIVGAISALVAFALVWLIGVMTNLAFYQRVSSTFVSPAGSHLGYWLILVPVIGGLLIGLMARYGSEKIRGHSRF
jgi:H+/Cl- antiporter ClcA